MFEAERAEDDVMRRPPRDPAQPLFSASLAGWGLLQGVLALGVVGSTAVVGMWRDMPEDEVRALAFVSLVATNVGLILVNRTFGASLLSPDRCCGRLLGPPAHCSLSRPLGPQQRRSFASGLCTRMISRRASWVTLASWRPSS